jgi:SpoVK/Ycf46/Vps4 family AAA+-type ATPase
MNNRAFSSDDFLTLAKLALSDNVPDVQMFLRKAGRRVRESDPALSSEIGRLLHANTGGAGSLRRDVAVAVPVDGDSRLKLLRSEAPSAFLERPVFSPAVEKQVSRLLRERKLHDTLSEAGLMPTRSALFVGPPGVGKTMTSKWVASQLGLPLFILDLSAVMSSFLGRTGNNLRAVLDYAKSQQCVLLLDELDAIAKRRDDLTEVGELKRLVTVILQEIEEWPDHSLLLAATNHAELLDPAVWRRFDAVINFPLPSSVETEKAIRQLFARSDQAMIGEDWIAILSILLGSMNLSDLEKQVSSLRRDAILDEAPLPDVIESFIVGKVESLSHAQQIELAVRLAATPDVSQRKASDLTGVSRETIRKHSELLAQA